MGVVSLSSSENDLTPAIGKNKKEETPELTKLNFYWGRQEIFRIILMGTRGGKLICN